MCVCINFVRDQKESIGVLMQQLFHSLTAIPADLINKATENTANIPNTRTNKIGAIPQMTCALHTRQWNVGSNSIQFSNKTTLHKQEDQIWRCSCSNVPNTSHAQLIGSSAPCPYKGISRRCTLRFMDLWCLEQECRLPVRLRLHATSDGFRYAVQW